ncbi:MAG: cytochrome c3 family protein, partial [Thermoanaerobaculia bacterium]
YLQDFWIDCTTCHHDSDDPACPQACSTCHHSAPHAVADETMSAKVVIHQSCWKCHEVATGPEATRNCGVCHQGAVRPASQDSAGHDQLSPQKEVEG